MQKRLDYLDALRGLAILFIVFGHIPICLYHSAEEFSSFRDFISIVKLPIFFFVSGFVFDIKKISKTNGTYFFKKKFQQLIIPATIIGSIYFIINDINFNQIIYSKFKGGFWFTYTLFELIIFHYLLEIVTIKFHLKNNKFYYVISLLFATVFYIFSIPYISNGFHIIFHVLGFPMLRYYLYFLIGNIIRNNLEFIIQWKYLNQLSAIIFIIFWVLFIFKLTPYKLNGLLFHINSILLQLSSLLLFFTLFYKYKSFFSSNHCFAKILTFLGKRTLDIYLLHYFFLPKDLQIFEAFFASHPIEIFEALFSMVLTLIIIGLCLLTSELIRCNSIISKYILGSK